MSSESLQGCYRESRDHVRGTFAGDPEAAARHYRRYVDFVVDHLTTQPAKLLDVGCGNGWSSYLFRHAGHHAFGADLHTDALEARQLDPELPYVSADVRRLPFPDAVFDAVALHAVLEHVPDPECALLECVRVLRPRGRLVVVGPHLLSIGVALYCVLRETWSALRRGGRWTGRHPDTPRHPFGNTLRETWWHLCHHTAQTVRKLVAERPVRFLVRIPDPSPPFHADNDACYWCNPMDLLNWARQTPGLRPVRWWAGDRLGARLLWPVAGGTWIVAEKE